MYRYWDGHGWIVCSRIKARLGLVYTIVQIEYMTFEDNRWGKDFQMVLWFRAKRDLPSPSRVVFSSFAMLALVRYNPKIITLQPRVLIGHLQPYSPTHPSIHALELQPQQIRDHLSTSNVRSSPQCWKIQRTAQPIRKTKEQHRRDPSSSVLKSETSLVHLVLLDGTSAQVVN